LANNNTQANVGAGACQRWMSALDLAWAGEQMPGCSPLVLLLLQLLLSLERETMLDYQCWHNHFWHTNKNRNAARQHIQSS